MEKELLEALRNLVALIKAGILTETILETKGGCLDEAVDLIARAEGRGLRVTITSIFPKEGER